MAAVRHLGFIGTTHDNNLVVSMGVPNLVKIDAVVSIGPQVLKTEQFR